MRFTIPLEGIRLGQLPITTMSLGAMLCGFFTVAQFSFWGNYLPRVYPLHLRGTGESFAANIGGRLIGCGELIGEQQEEMGVRNGTYGQFWRLPESLETTFGATDAVYRSNEQLLFEVVGKFTGR